MKSKYVIMRPGKGPGVPTGRTPRNNEIIIKINSARFEEGFRYVITWEMLAWRKPIFAMSEE